MQEFDIEQEHDTDLEGLELEKAPIDLTEGLRWLTAGKCIATFVDKIDSTRFTYKVKKAQRGNIYFVSVLAGANNTSDYSYIGYIKIINNMPSFIHGGEKSRIKVDANSVVFFKEVFNTLLPWYLYSNNGTYNRTQNVRKAMSFSDISTAEQTARNIKIADYTIVCQQLIKDKSLYFIQKNIASERFVMWRSSHCCRCGRTLTVDTSIKQGMGDYCASKYLKGNHRLFL